MPMHDYARFSLYKVTRLQFVALFPNSFDHLLLCTRMKCLFLSPFPLFPTVQNGYIRSIRDIYTVFTVGRLVHHKLGKQSPKRS